MESFERKQKMESTLNARLVDSVRNQLIRELEEALPYFGEGWQADVRDLIAALRDKRPTVIGGRIFSEYLDGILQERALGPEAYKAIWNELESPTSG